MEVLLLSLRGGRLMEKEVVLTAFGRTWSEPADVIQTSAVTKSLVVVPAVRVPTVFSVVDRGRNVVGEVVVYPDRDVAWNQETKQPGQDEPARKIALHATAAPQWFTEWAAAVGLPVRSISVTELSPTPVDAGGELPPVLLVVGRAAAGQGPGDLQTLAEEKRVNVLVLEASWFGPVAGKTAVEPRRMQAGLAEMASQQWPEPPEFAAHASPHGGIVNRWAWMTDRDGLPLVEEVRWVDTDRRSREQQRTPPEPRVIVSYLPWPERLGRSESADSLLVALLKAAAQPRRELHWRMAEMTWPPETEILAAERPVLAAALQAWPVMRDIPSRIHVLDLRGSKEPPLGMTRELRKIEPEDNPTVDDGGRNELLILGDDKLLDEWKWLDLNRPKKRVGRRGAVWLEDDTLPPSAAQQVRLMMKFTELGIPLVCTTTKKETNNER
ncbi:MAG: hypothetical protein GXY74_11365 [Phycisphaerae bacterium]|nr:hypothetical protein [Phycisphaerae bacterium]